MVIYLEFHHENDLHAPVKSFSRNLLPTPQVKYVRFTSPRIYAVIFQCFDACCQRPDSGGSSGLECDCKELMSLECNSCWWLEGCSLPTWMIVIVFDCFVLDCGIADCYVVQLRCLGVVLRFCATRSASGRNSALGYIRMLYVGCIHCSDDINSR